MTDFLSSWQNPCGSTADGEDAWCSFHLAELTGRDRAKLASSVSTRGGFVQAITSCGIRTRGVAIPLGVVLDFDLDLAVKP